MTLRKPGNQDSLCLSSPEIRRNTLDKGDEYLDDFKGIFCYDHGCFTRLYPTWMRIPS